MGYLSKGRLRAYLDGELDATEHEAVEREISRGAPAARAARLGATAETVRSRLEVVAPQTEPDLEPAIARARASRRQGAQAASGERSPSMGSRIIRKPALAGGLVLLLLVGLLSFGQGRAFARQLLSVFRVRRFAVVQMRLDPDRFEEVVSHLEETLFVTGDPVMIQEPTRTTVDTIEEASTAAGFDVRMPAYWPDGGTPRITVEGPSEQALRFRGDGLRLLLELAEMDPAAIPAELLEDEVRVASGGAVYLKGSNTSITQVSNITASYPDGIDVAMIVEAALRVLGVDPDEAHRLSQAHDWSCTALIPVLSDAIAVRETEIAGADALLVRAESQGPHANRATLLMERDGILYIVEGSASFERLAQIAQSMF